MSPASRMRHPATRPRSRHTRASIADSTAGDARVTEGVDKTVRGSTEGNIFVAMTTKARPESKEAIADRNDRRASEVRKLSTLVEISQALSGTLDLRSGLTRALELLEQHHNVVAGFVTLKHDENNELEVIATSPRTPVTVRGRVRSVDNVTDQVIRTGRAVVVPNIADEPMLKAKLADR